MAAEVRAIEKFEPKLKLHAREILLTYSEQPKELGDQVTGPPDVFQAFAELGNFTQKQS